MFSSVTKQQAEEVLAGAKSHQIRLCSVETVTSGLLAAALSSVPGASEVFERGFILYHESAKATGLGVSAAISEKYGAVSSPVTEGLAEGGLVNSTAGLSIAITGYAGPGGGNVNDPVGTCYMAVARRDGNTVVERSCFDGGRDAVRIGAVNAALTLVSKLLKENLVT